MELQLQHQLFMMLHKYSGLISRNNFDVVQSLSHVCRSVITPWTAAHQASLSFTISPCLLKIKLSIESVISSSHLNLCRPLLLLPSVFPIIRVFSNESALCIRWPKYWSFSFSISPSNEYSGLISFRMDWLDLLAVPGTLKSLLHGEGNDNPLQCSCLENPRDRGAWWAAVYGVAESDTTEAT